MFIARAAAPSHGNVRRGGSARNSGGMNRRGAFTAVVAVAMALSAAMLLVGTVEKEGRTRAALEVQSWGAALGSWLGPFSWSMGVFGNSLDINQELFALKIKAENMNAHLEQLQSIADAHDGSRAVDLGYNASVEYVVEQLGATGFYDVTVQPFQFSRTVVNSEPEFAQVSPSAVEYVLLQDFRMLDYSGAGDVTARASYVNQGCDAADYSSFVAGRVAIAARGGCSFSDIADMAVAQGAVGVVIHNSGGVGESGAFSGTLGSAKSIPVFSVSFDLGMELKDTPLLQLHLFADTEEVVTYTSNVIATSQSGNASQAVVVGSHLDSVTVGPGINDNGSGSSANLEMALQFAAFGTPPENQVRFAWWGAEELGLLGSNAYVDSLVVSGGIEDVALNLNYDMLGSPNFFRGVYDGCGAAADIRNQSATITQMYVEYFDKEGLAWDFTEFNGRSDYGPFIANGVPAGGLFSGAEQKKDTDMRDSYGGLANAAFDTCYHNQCDSLGEEHGNVDMEVLQEMARAAAYVMYGLVMDKDLPNTLQGVNGIEECTTVVPRNVLPGPEAEVFHQPPVHTW